MIRFETSHGPFTVELFPKEAPVTVENFLRYVDEGFFDGTIFHRIVPGFVIQGGGLTAPPAGRGDVITRAEVEGDLGCPLGHGVELVGHGLVDVTAHGARTSRIRVAQSALTWAA